MSKFADVIQKLLKNKAYVLMWTMMLLGVLQACIMQIEAANTAYPSEIGLFSITSVYDGDTFFIDIPSLPPVFGKRLGVRVRNVDTPEMNSTDPLDRANAIKARDYVRSKIAEANSIILKDIGRDKYFRIDATVVIDGNDLSELLISHNLGSPY